MDAKEPTMSYRTPEFLREFVLVMIDTVSLAATARRMGVEQSTPFVWLRKSKQAAANEETNSEWMIEIDGEKRFFHAWIKEAHRICDAEIEANAKVRARDGVWKVAMYKGQTCYMLNEDWVDPSMRALLGLTDDDMYARDANGRLIPEMEWTPPAGDLTAFVLEHNTKKYQKRSQLDVNQRITSSVLVMGGPKQVAQPLPILDVIEPEQPSLAVTDTPPDQLPVAPEPEPDRSAAPKLSPVSASTSGPRIAQPTPPEYAPGPNPLITPGGNRPLTDVERAALQRTTPRLPDANNRKA
jgi:hypothetical protein